MNLEQARRFIDLGFCVIPLGSRSKEPDDVLPKGENGKPTWKPFQEKRPDLAQLQAWFGNGVAHNAAIVCGRISGIVVIDTDSPESESWCATHLSPTPMMTRTQRGFHRYYRRPSAIPDLPRHINVSARCKIEVRSDGQYVVAPGSVHPSGVTYEETTPWPATLDTVPVLDLGVIADINEGNQGNSQIAPREPVVHGVSREHRMRLAEDWLTRQSVAIQGQQGDTHTYAICCGVANDHDLTPEDAFEILREWNARCEPPWTDADLRQKIRGSAQYAKGPRGSKLVFKRDAKKRIRANHQFNIRLALYKMGVSIDFDDFAKKIRIHRHGESMRVFDDEVAIPLWLELEHRYGFRPSRELFDSVVKAAAWKRRVHPVCAYLDGVRWDGQPRLDRWLIDYAGAADTAFVRAVGPLVLLAAVRRVRDPGCKFDEMLILEATQGTLKSSALKALCKNEDWFSDDLPLGADAKQIIERTAGKWIIEAAELHGSRKREAEQLKSFLSRGRDGPVRLAYAHLPSEVLRQFVILGTTNQLTGYLKDATGARRFWRVRVKQFDVDALKRDRDQLWAEAAAREVRGESIRLDPSLYDSAGQQQDQRRQVDPWEEWLLQSEEIDWTADFIEVSKIWEALHIEAKHQDNNAADRVGAIMQRHGFTHKRKKWIAEQYRQRWCWVRAEVQGDMFEEDQG